MPEGHTLHRIAQDHQKWFAGQKLLASSPQGRFAEEAGRLSGKVLICTEAFGKHLVYRFENKANVHIHLGLYGKFRPHMNPAPPPVGAVRLRMVGKTRSFDLNGPNKCQLISELELSALEDRLGPDPLREDADPEKAWEKIKRSSSAIGTLLLNQSVIAGVGNIYRAEILHALAIHPDRLGKDITREEFSAIWETTVRFMQVGVEYDRIITAVHPRKHTSIDRLKADERLMIYKKPICPRCDSDVYYWQLGSRTVYACDSCQK